MRCGKNLDDGERLERLSAYMDGTMEPDERGDWEEHLTQCGTCRADLDWMGRTAELLRGQMEEVPESFSRGWRDAVRQEAARSGGAGRPEAGGDIVPVERDRRPGAENRAKRPLLRWVSSAAAVVAVVGVGLWAAGWAQGDGGASPGETPRIYAYAAEEPESVEAEGSPESGIAPTSLEDTMDVPEAAAYDPEADVQQASPYARAMPGNGEECIPEGGGSCPAILSCEEEATCRISIIPPEGEGEQEVFAAVSAWLEARGYTAQYALHGDDYGIFLQGLSEAAEGLLEDLRASGFDVQVPEGADLTSPFLYVE